MKKQLVIALAAIALAGCNSIKISHVSNAKKLKNDYYYVLPKTAFSFDVPVHTTSFKAAKNKTAAADIAKNSDVVKYCEKKFGLDKTVFLTLVAGNSVTPTSELSAVTFSTVAKPDFNKVFKVKAKPRFMNEQSTGFTYSGDGIASQSDASHQNTSLKTAGKILEGIVSIVGAIKGGAGLKAAASPTPDLTPYPELKNLDDLTTSYIKLQLTPSDIIDPVVYKELIQTYEGIIRKKFAEIFYTEKTETKTLKILYCPSTEALTQVRLFKLEGGSIIINSAIKNDIEVFGLVGNSYGTINNDICYRLSLANKTNGLGDYVTAYDPSKVSGYTYNLPASFIVTLKDEKDKIIIDQPVKLPQFGTMGSISKKQSKVSIEWNTETGELKKVSGESKGVSGDDISGGAAAAAVSAIDAIKGDDETAQLEKEVKLLELKKKREELKSAGID